MLEELKDEFYNLIYNKNRYPKKHNTDLFHKEKNRITLGLDKYGFVNMDRINLVRKAIENAEKDLMNELYCKG